MEEPRRGRPEIPGWGADLAPERRPGVPMETEPRPAPGAHWTEPDRQTSGEPVRAAARRPIPVFGTAQPPRGLSGVIRQFAHAIPEHRARRWALLLLADRVDVLEDRIAEGVRSQPIPTAAAVAGMLLLILAVRREAA